MSLFKKLERRDYGGGVLTNPFGPPNYVIPTNGQLAYVDGANGIAMPTSRAMQHWTVFACIRLIADVISSLPVDVFVGDNSTSVSPVPTKILKPSAYANTIDWLWQVVASLLSRGNAYGLYGSFDRLGYPTQIDLISPEKVSIIKSDEPDSEGQKLFKIGNKTLTTDQVWHLPGPQLPGELEGLSPIRYASRLISLGLDAETFGSDFFRNGIHPTATLETDQPVNTDQAKGIKARVKEAVANRDFAVLGAGMKLNPWQLKADESQFLETMQHNSIAVAQIFGVPAEMLGVSFRGTAITYANREQRAQDFLNSAINPWLARLESSLSAWFPRGTYVKFNTGALLRSDLTSRYDAYNIGIHSGFLMPSEARELENLPVIPGIDDKPLPSSAPQGSGGGKKSSQGSANDNQG